MLLPKKSSEFFKETAEQFDVSEELVKDLISFYWAEIRRLLSSCEVTDVIVEGLGTFRARSWKIEEILLKHRNTINKYKVNVEEGQKISFYKFAILKEVEENMNRILKLQEMLQIEESKKQSVKQKRYAQKVKNNLEEQSSDMGRLQEPDIQD